MVSVIFTRTSIVFANCPSTTTQRKAMKVRVSYNEGATWAATQTVTEAWGGYSSVLRLANDQIGLFYEAGENKGFERLELARFSMKWLTEGKAPASTSPSAAMPIEWQALPDIPDPLGLAGPIVGQTNGAILFAGGANFPDAPPWKGGKKTFSSRVHVLGTDGKWITDAGKLPRPIGYGVSITTDRGVIVVGGCDATQCYADVQRLTWSASGGLKTAGLCHCHIPWRSRPARWLATRSTSSADKRRSTMLTRLRMSMRSTYPKKALGILSGSKSSLCPARRVLWR